MGIGMGVASAILGWRSNKKCGDVAKRWPLPPLPPRVNLGTALEPAKFNIYRFKRERMIRDDIKAAQIAAMKSGDKAARGAISLIQSAVKNRDIELRTGTAPSDDDAVVVEVLQKMIKQRRESIEMYTKGGRQELADAEAAEIAVIERFLPAQLSDDELAAAIEAIKAELGASSMKDMGRVVAELKARHASQLDMSKASGAVKAALA